MSACVHGPCLSLSSAPRSPTDPCYHLLPGFFSYVRNLGLGEKTMEKSGKGHWLTILMFLRTRMSEFLGCSILVLPGLRQLPVNSAFDDPVSESLVTSGTS